MTEKENAFLICPVRNISDNYREAIMDQVEWLESNYNLYYPARDTDQRDPTGYRICANNLGALMEADVVLIIWDGKSQGVLFDAGMAFALGKKLRIVTGYMPAMTRGKSFQNMFYDWENRE